jgi:hypothetical protein
MHPAVGIEVDEWWRPGLIRRRYESTRLGASGRSCCGHADDPDGQGSWNTEDPLRLTPEDGSRATISLILFDPWKIMRVVLMSIHATSPSHAIRAAGAQHKRRAAVSLSKTLLEDFFKRKSQNAQRLFSNIICGSSVRLVSADLCGSRQALVSVHPGLENRNCEDMAIVPPFTYVTSSAD